VKTTCPRCASVFRLTPEQLTARDGWVRCGVCEQVFDAGETLVAEDGLFAEEGPIAEEGPLPWPDLPELPDLADLADLADQAAEAARLGGESNRPAAAPEPAYAAVIEIAHPAPDAALDALLAPPPEIPTQDRPIQDRPRQPARASMPWLKRMALGASFILLIVLLLGQIVFLLRDAIAVRAPTLRPVLEAACAPLGCAVTLPRDLDAVRLVASDLQSEPARPGRLVLVAELRNHADIALAWPRMELTLTDIRNAPVSRRFIESADYLPAGTRADAGFPAGQTLGVSVALEVGTLDAAGYRLELVY
jgi:predicted Zn finger-like uncharacterized protein